MCHLSIKFCENWFSSFPLILLANKQANKQTNANENITSLVEVIISPLTALLIFVLLLLHTAMTIYVDNLSTVNIVIINSQHTAVAHSMLIHNGTKKTKVICFYCNFESCSQNASEHGLCNSSQPTSVSTLPCNVVRQIVKNSIISHSCQQNT